jgi:hypothetical protein
MVSILPAGYSPVGAMAAASPCPDRTRIEKGEAAAIAPPVRGYPAGERSAQDEQRATYKVALDIAAQSVTVRIGHVFYFVLSEVVQHRFGQVV